MNSELSSPLTSLDTALSTLITSISTYNPSLPAADALISADASLSKSLDRLSTHQSNYAHIQDLRAALSSLDATITSTLSTLASTRQELQSLTLTPPADDTTRAVGYKELLSYAKKVAYTSIPPPGFAPPAILGNGTEEARESTKEPDISEGTSAQADTTGIYDQQNKVTALPAEELQRMREAEGARAGGWTPWVSDEVIRAGGLAGVDWSAVGIDGDAAEQKAEAVEEPKNQPIGDWQGQSNAIAPMVKEQQPVKEKAVFGGLDLYDPDDD